MAKIIGLQHMDFDTKEGTHIDGTTLFVTNPIDPRRGTGDEAEKIFISSAKLKELSFSPSVGDNIEVLYNRYGKVRTLNLIDVEID